MPYQFLKSSVLGKPLDRSVHYNIYGAGVAGLLLGYYLKKNHASFTIYEKQAFAGGLLQSAKLNNGLAEGAANGFLWSAEMAEILSDIGLEAIPAIKTNSAKYFVKNKQLTKMPLNALNIFSGILNVILPHSLKPNTIAEFGDTYLSNNFTENILSPAMSGIYAAYADELSFPGAMQSVAKKLDRSTWLPKAIFSKAGDTTSAKPLDKRGTHSFPGGMGEFTATLANFLQDNIVYNYTTSNEDIGKGNAIVCLPAYQAAYLFTDEKIKAILNTVEYNPIASGTFIFNKAASDKFKKGFGCLIPKGEGFSTLGILFNSYIFDGRVNNPDLISLTCIARGKDLVNCSEKELTGKLLAELDSLFELKQHPVETRVYQYPQGIPLYSPSLYENWFVLNNLLTSIDTRLFGNYTGQISIRGMAKEAKQACSNL